MLVTFILQIAVFSLIRPIRLTDDGNRQEEENPSYVDMPEGDNDEGKS
jgi:hypothetical protein